VDLLEARRTGIDVRFKVDMRVGRYEREK